MLHRIFVYICRSSRNERLKKKCGGASKRRSVEATQVSTAAIRCDSSFFSLFLRIKIRPTHPDRQQPDSNLCTQFDMHAMANKEEHRGEGGAASAALVNDRSIGKDNKNNKRSLALSLQSHNLQPWSYPPKFF